MPREDGPIGRGVTMRPTRWIGVAAAVLLLGPVVAEVQPGAGPSGCEQCHATLTVTQLAVPVEGFADDVHRDQGFGCVDCHGGDGAVADKEAAKGPTTGYRGTPGGVDQVAMCVACHGDAEFMRRYAPRQRVDQGAEYASSTHGLLLGAGREDVATCTSCHGVHGIRNVSDAQSPVYPTNVAATCGRCHADPEHMGTHPTDQVVDYESSVHHEALTVGNDLSAPTCNDCHGNHGAAPPGVDDVANVCSTCHALFGSRFAESTHALIFGCAECHGNHAIQPSRAEMLGTSDGAVCVECHAEGDRGFEVAGLLRTQIDGLMGALEMAEALTARVHNAGMEVADQELAAAEARTRVTLARTELHAADPDLVAPIIAEGHELVVGIEEAGAAQLDELEFRRVGLGISLAAILLVVVALYLKIRQLDRRHRVGHHAPEVEPASNAK